MLISASCQIKVSNVGDRLEVNCVGHGETEESPYDFSVCIEIEESELEACLARCLLLFEGMLEISDNDHIDVWEPSRAAIFLLNMWQAAQNGESFDIM